MSANRPSVVFLNHWADTPGGAEHSLLDIIVAAQDRFRCTLITAEEGWLTERVRAAGVAVRVVAGGKGVAGIGREHLLASLVANLAGLASFALFMLRLRRIIAEIRPDCIHANVPKSHIALFLLVRLGFDRTCVFHIREIFPRKSLALRLYRRLFPPAAHVIAISQAVKDALPTVMQRRCRAIRNGVAIPPEPIRVDHAPHRQIRLLYLGRIVEWKGCHYLLDILEGLCLRYPDVDIRLTLAGGSFHGGAAYRTRLARRIGGMEHASRIQLLDHVEATGPLFLSHDIFCNASWQEPFGQRYAGVEFRIRGGGGDRRERRDGIPRSLR